MDTTEYRRLAKKLGYCPSVADIRRAEGVIRLLCDEIDQSKRNGFGLTPKTKDLWSFICKYYSTHKVTPSYREMMRANGCKSTSQIASRVKILQRRGYIDFRPREARSVKILKWPAGVEQPEVFIE